MACCSSASAEANKLTSKVMFIKHDGVGEGELGTMLMGGFMQTLTTLEQLPSKIIFVNRGVYCTTKDGELINTLKKLEAMGVEIYSCGTCLDFFGIRDQLKVGKAGNAKDTLDTLIASGGTITL